MSDFPDDSESKMVCKHNHKDSPLHFCHLCDELVCKKSLEKHMFERHPDAVEQDWKQGVAKVVARARKLAQDKIDKNEEDSQVVFSKKKCKTKYFAARGGKAHSGTWSG